MTILCFGVFSEIKSQVGLPARHTHNLPVNNALLVGTDSVKVTWVDTLLEGADRKMFVIRSACKGFIVRYPVFNIEHRVSVKGSPVFTPAPVADHIPLLKVTGNILYDVNYSSRIDTPYAENNIYQHTLQTRLDFVYRDQYPFKIYLTTRFSNSPLFRKYTDLNFRYTQADFTRLVKNKILAAAESLLASRMKVLDSLRKLIDLEKARALSLKQVLQKPDLSQRMVEDRERTLFGNPGAKKKTDTVWNFGDDEKIVFQKEKFGNFLDEEIDTSTELGKVGNNRELADYSSKKEDFEKNKKKLDSLLTGLEQLEKMYKNLSASQLSSQHDWKKEIEQAGNANELAHTMQQLQLPDSLLPKGYTTLSAVQSFNIGRTVANYSELSVKNVSITGLQVEFNPGYYYAVAVGKVDYRFRDYIVPNEQPSNQYLALVRFGKGMRNGNHVIFTYYTGRRQLYNVSVASQTNVSIPEYQLAGMSLEGYYKINKTTFFVAEVAKSTTPYYSLDSLKRKNWMGTITNFKDRTNEAYSIQVYSFLPKTQTRLIGNVRYFGASFQSFSSFTTGASQMNWKGSLEQPFFKKTLTVISSLQQNGYNDPYVTTAYKSSYVLASFLVNLRIKKWPSFSAGFYPSYQLTKMGENNFTESRYYTMMASSSYYYPIRTVQLSSSVVYTQFYNQASDSGFVYFNSKNLLISHNLTINKWSMLINLSESINTGYSIYSMENNDQFAVNSLLAVGAGIKWIKNSISGNPQWGYSGNLTMRIPKLGDIQLIMDKGYMPGINYQLVENKVGRLTYFKTF